MVHLIFCKGDGLTPFLHVNPQSCTLGSGSQESLWSLWNSFTKAWCPAIASKGLCYTLEAVFPKSLSKEGRYFLPATYLLQFRSLLSAPSFRCTEGFQGYWMKISVWEYFFWYLISLLSKESETAESSIYINSANLSSSALLTSLSACIVKNNYSVYICIVQTMPVLLGAILFRASRHCFDPRGSLENTLVDKTAFLHVSSVSVSFQVWLTIKSHHGGVRKRRSQNTCLLLQRFLC